MKEAQSFKKKKKKKKHKAYNTKNYKKFLKLQKLYTERHSTVKGQKTALLGQQHSQTDLSTKHKPCPKPPAVTQAHQGCSLYENCTPSKAEWQRATLGLSVRQLMDTWAVSTPWLLQTKLLRAPVYNLLYKRFSVLLDILTRRWTVDYNITMLNLLRNCQTFPRQLHHLTMPSAEYEGFNFSPTLLTLLMVFSTTVNPSGCGVVSHCGYELHFPKDLEHLFMCLSAPSLEKISIQTH